MMMGDNVDTVGATVTGDTVDMSVTFFEIVRKIKNKRHNLKQMRNIM